MPLTEMKRYLHLRGVQVCKEIQLKIYPTEVSRYALNRTEKIFALKRIQFVDGDRNTKFFHSYVKGRRKKLHI